MKKLIVSALALTLISFASVQAQTTEPATQATQQEVHKDAATTQKTDKEEKVAVKVEDLPAGIKKTIQGEEFTGWTVKKAFLVTETDKTQYYELLVAKGSESARVKLDKNGNNVG
jgi:Flp pilus assembly protein CpaB